MRYDSALEQQTARQYDNGTVEKGVIKPIEDRGSVWFVEISTSDGRHHRKLIQLIRRSENGRVTGNVKPDSSLEISSERFKLTPGQLDLRESNT
jgi:hypothetical protein